MCLLDSIYCWQCYFSLLLSAVQEASFTQFAGIWHNQISDCKRATRHGNKWLKEKDISAPISARARILIFVAFLLTASLVLDVVLQFQFEFKNPKYLHELRIGFIWLVYSCCTSTELWSYILKNAINSSVNLHLIWERNSLFSLELYLFGDAESFFWSMSILARFQRR